MSTEKCVIRNEEEEQTCEGTDYLPLFYTSPTSLGEIYWGEEGRGCIYACPCVYVHIQFKSGFGFVGEQGMHFLIPWRRG